MALVNPQSLYSGAAQVFNNAPHLALQARLLYQQKAKQDALENYYRRLPLTINDKGTRDNERESIYKGREDLSEFWVKNKDKLKQGDDSAALEFEKKVRDLKDLIHRSQVAGLTNMQVGKLFLNPATSYVSSDKEFMNKLHAHDIPVDDPNHVGLDLDEIMLPPKPYDRAKYFKNFAQMKGNENVSVFKNLDGVTQTIVNAPSYDEPQKEYVMSVAADNYLHDPSFTKMVDEDLGAADATNPLNADFKANFGHDIQTPIDLATAYTFNGLKPEPIKEKIQTDLGAMLKKREAFAMNKMYANDELIRGRMKTAKGYREAMVDYKQAKTTGEEERILNKYIENSYTAGVNRVNGTNVDHINIDGKEYKGKVIDVPNSVKKEFIEYDKKTGIGRYADAFYLTDDKKTVVPLFLGDKVKTGGYQIQSQSKPVSVQTFKVSLAKSLLTKKTTGSEVINDEFDLEDVPEVPQQSTKTKTKKDPLGLF